ncbi:hypothetical protein HER10_EVM0012864 [Colletotrichum scovillei]|uniref:FAD binding domain protein n=1 Tax=Colletotrichum scovillei TaxID=1209932 RepID=A0A9P7UGV9_9PEZI|nr:uncharacterized protein HER10_EVM0012864 [Colletotrichum scovillei]KAF4780557.1 hypothetical protein HER10_EVM0012864 [Colletotrichum scovillei]KAG7057324.1 FAD binding domain protein [Colletotrichum scovillei]KAG7083099.1 FAD binding domain protein [Colletotrichum scovillei]
MLATISSESKRAASQTAVSLLQSVLEERDKVFVRTGGNNSRKKHGLVEEIAQSAAAGIGTISEALHHRREKKSRALDPQRPSSHSGSISNTESTPIQLDEGTGKANTPDLGAATPMSTSPPSQNIHDLASAFIKRHPLKTTGSSEDGQRLSLPVLVPQRRPEKRARGFIRAYAPMLVDVKINQDTFLDFIDTLNKSLEPNPWISAVNLAGFAGEALPDPASLLFGFAVEAATEAVMEGQSLFCSNKFLNCVNADFFIPRGLVCLVVTWQPDNDCDQVATNFVEEVDTLQTKPDLKREISDVAAGKKKPSEGWQELKTQMGDLMKPTRGDFKWPEPAPLIFPDVKSTPKKGDVEAKKKNAWDRMEDWINNHSDKRAQASWIDENKNHPRMNLMPQPKFKSRYADPNHQVSSGDLVSLVTGGRWRLATDTKDETSKRPERMADEKCDKEKGLRESSNKDEKKKKSTTKDRKKGILEADREKKDDGETGEITAYQERSLETVSLRSHTEEGGAEKDVGKDGVTNTKDICRVGEIEGGDRGMVRAKEAKKKAGSSSKSGDVFKGLFQKDVLYLAILELPSQGKAD